MIKRAWPPICMDTDLRWCAFAALADGACPSLERWGSPWLLWRKVPSLAAVLSTHRGAEVESVFQNLPPALYESKLSVQGKINYPTTPQPPSQGASPIQDIYTQILSLTSASLLKGMGIGTLFFLNLISKMSISSSLASLCEVLVLSKVLGSRDGALAGTWRLHP